MSATNRGTERNERDYYVTPVATVKNFLETFADVEPNFNFETAHFLDPCAGGDKDQDMTYPTVLSEMGARSIETIDIRSDSRANIISDYLTIEGLGLYDAIFTNPPYGIGLEFISKAITNVRQGGFVGMILRLNYYGTVSRKHFWKENMPKWTFVHAKRPSFCKGSTDATEYAHLVWQVGYKPRFSNLIVI